MEEKGQIFDMAEISVAGPLHVWDAIRRQWKRVRGSLLKNSSHLIISIQGKPGKVDNRSQTSTPNPLEKYRANQR